MVEGEIKEYVTKDEIMETVEVKRNHLCQRRIIRGQLRRQKELARIHYEAIQGTDRLESKQAGYDVEHRSRVVSPITAKEAIFISRLFKAMTLQLNEPLIIDNTQTLRLITEDTAKLITKLRHLLILVASRIRNETSDISMESDEGDDRRWTYEGPAQAEVQELRQYDRNGGYQGAAE